MLDHILCVVEDQQEVASSLTRILLLSVLLGFVDQPTNQFLLRLDRARLLVHLSPLLPSIIYLAKKDPLDGIHETIDVFLVEARYVDIALRADLAVCHKVLHVASQTRLTHPSEPVQKHYILILGNERVQDGADVFLAEHETLLLASYFLGKDMIGEALQLASGYPRWLFAFMVLIVWNLHIVNYLHLHLCLPENDEFFGFFFRLVLSQVVLDTL